MEKVRQTIYLDNTTYFSIYSYCEKHNCKSISEAINAIIPEWRRFKKIAANLQDEVQKQERKLNDKNKDK